MTGKTETEVSKLEDIFKKYEEVRGPLISLLQEAQKALGYLPPSALETISKRTGVPLSEVYGAATFYAQFSLEPKARNVIRVCHGTACHVSGAVPITESFEVTLGIKETEATPDKKFSLERVNCLGCCSLAPVVMVNQDAHGRLTPQKVKEVIKKYD